MKSATTRLAVVTLFASLATAGAQAQAPATRTPAEEFQAVLTQPDGAAKARKIYDAAKAKDKKAVLFAEQDLNQHGYTLLQEGRHKDAIVIFQMNLDAYPESANCYDSLSDGYLAAGNNADALKYAERAIEKLAKDTTSPDEFKQAVRDSAEKKIATLKKKTD